MMTGNSSGERGAIFTKKEVVDFMLDEVGYVSTQNLSDIRVLEPSSGEGAFAIEIIHRLYESSTRFSFDFGKALKNLYFVEIDEKALSVLKIRLRSYLKENMDLFKKINFLLDDFLLTKMPSNFDLIIGNPPYIRWDKISREKKSQYFNLFKTFRGRADIYIPFFEKSLSLLTHGGVLSFICSNRWFKSAYGKYLRRLVVSNYRLEKIIDLEQVNPFTSKVTAYPAITTIKNNFDANHLFYEYHELDNIESLCQDIKYKNIRYEPYSGKVWRQDDSIDFRNRRIFKKIEDQGFKIKIGVATGKDAVFIGSDLDDKVENELLIPLVKSSHLRNNEFTESDLKIINVFEKGGTLIDITKYPKLYQYLSRHKAELMSRHIAKKNPEKWYRTIDKIRINDIALEKILLPDISGNSIIFIDDGKYYPHHNIYYITHSNVQYLYVLACVLMSDFVRDQLESLGNKMNGGYPRWQSQNLRRLIIPDVTRMSGSWITRMIELYHTRDLNAINASMSEKLIQNEFEDKGQMTLFESMGKYKKTPPNT